MITRNVGAYLKTVHGGEAEATAGGSGDNAAKDGEKIDRAGWNSCALAILSKATVSAGKKLDVSVQIADSDDNATFGAKSTIFAKQTTVTNAAAGTYVAANQVNLDLSGYKRYIRFTVTPDLDATGTDTAAVMLAAVLGGSDDFVPVD